MEVDRKMSLKSRSAQTKSMIFLEKVSDCSRQKKNTLALIFWNCSNMSDILSHGKLEEQNKVIMKGLGCG